MNLLKKAFDYYFDKWWKPIVFALITCLLDFISSLTEINIIENICFSLFILADIGLITSIIVQFTSRRWIGGIITILVFPLIIFIYINLSIFLFIYAESMPDKFADNLTIPANLKIEKPFGPIDIGFDIVRPDSIINLKRESQDLILYNSFQPGCYEYDFWTERIEHGTIYLKAFEITKNLPLSSERLREASTVKVYNPNDSIIRFGTKNNFTIYEGDWGKPYAARFEVWFKPDSSEHENKIFEKNYKIEGWMR